jgi:hypothetical protein
MSKNFSSFLLKAGFIAVILSTLAFFSLSNYTQTFKSSSFHFLNLFVFGVTTIVHYLLLKEGKKRAQKFVNSFMLSITAKLMIFFTVIIAYAFTHKTEAAAFIVCFFIMYLIYTTFEVIEILKYLKQQ